MSLVRFFPTPSDRMGILWSLLTIRNSIVLEYGPAGTTHYSMGFYGTIGIDQENRLFTTHMSEDDVVMGDVTRLEKAIVEVDEAYRPEVLFVVASSVSAVIGSDLRGVCNYMQDQTKARLIALEQGGFRGDYGIGLQQVYQLIAETLIQSSEEKIDRYNIVGASLYSRRARSDINEIKRLMQDAFSMPLNACFLMDTSISELENAAKAKLNLCLRPEARPLCLWMQQEHGIPFVEHMPYGYAGTRKWLEAIEERLGTQAEEALMKELKQKEKRIQDMQMFFAMMRKNRPANATLFGEYEPLLGLGDFLEECGIKVSLRALTQSPRVIEDLPDTIQPMAEEKERLKVVKELHQHLLLADDALLHVAPNDNHKLRISPPVLYASEAATHLPICGLRGADWMMEEIDAYLYPLK